MSENLWFSDVFRGYRKVTLDQNGLMRLPKRLTKLKPQFLKAKQLVFHKKRVTGFNNCFGKPSRIIKVFGIEDLHIVFGGF